MNKFSQAKYSGLQVFYSCNNKQSETLAKIIQSNTQKFQQNENNRETKMAGSNIYLLHNIKNPAVLVECGFLSNQEECEKLKNEIYRKEIALVIYSSIIEFFEKI
jgi:N-acetylmuramoyl-L-alanine amidase